MLSRTNLYDNKSVELAYYKDSEKKPKQKKIINLSTVTNVSPVQKSGNKENVFALETRGKHVLLKASSSLLQNVWVAKLLECCAKGEHLKSNLEPIKCGSGFSQLLCVIAGN